MIASDDVRRVTFDRAMRGYRCEDVDDYLKQVADSIDSLAAENDDLQKKLVILAQRIDQYRADEDTLSTTMINAQRLGENVIKEAKQKAAEIIRAANIKAEDREQRARDEVELAQQELVTIKQEADAFKKRLMDLYRQHIEMIAKIPEYHTNRAEQQAAQPQPEKEETGDALLNLDTARRFAAVLEKEQQLMQDAQAREELAAMHKTTTAICDWLEAHPESQPKARRFAEYYIPTTLKLLHTYNDVQGQQGENAETIRRDIAGILHTLNQAYENLYNNLLSDVAMDISSEIAALQGMLANDGLTGREFE